MKTAVIMVRDLNGVSVRQNHKTWFFNANDLLDLYNKNNKKKKEMWAYLKTDNFKSFQEAVIKNEILNTNKNTELENSFKTIETKRWKYWWTWMHPYIFLDFAMWLSPDFKVNCMKWLYDNLIKFRDECGDSFKKVNKALFDKKPNLPPFEYSNEAKMINKIVFWSPNGGQRNLATAEQLELLKKLQESDVKLIQKWLDYYERYIKLNEIKEYL
jgi:hypothetical protein